MAAGPLVPWGRGSWRRLTRLLRRPAAIALAGALVLWLAGAVSPGMAAWGYAVSFFVIAAVLDEFVRATRGRRRATGERTIVALGRLLRHNHRRYGGLVVHLGVVVLAIGVTTSTAGKLEHEATLKRGESLDIGPYRLRFVGFEATEQPTHLLVSAEVEVLENGRPVTTLRPGQRMYPTSQSPFASVDVRYGILKDLYLILGAFDRGGQWATFKAQIHPMIAWIWLGGVIVLLGGVIALWPSERRRPVVPVSESASASRHLHVRRGR
jgi:cytochrome c-type biogenesis protein CcmF